MYLHFPTLWKSLGLTFSRKHFHPRHAFLTVLFLVPFFLLRTGIWFLRLLDHALYPGYKKQPLNSPIFIIGNPRSGTTFTHRLMALDSGYTKFTLWQTIFPAVCCYRFIRLLCRADASLGKPFSRMLEFASRRGFAGWSHIHKTGPGSVESDEMLFVYAFLSPLITLLFPFPGELPSVLYPDRLPERERKKLMRYYVDCLRRHMYATGPDKILLEKVALIAGRIESIYQAVPGLRIVHLVRHPYESIPSLISMFAVSWRFFHPEAARGNANKELSEMVFDYYRSLMEFTAKLPPERFLAVPYTDLVADPSANVNRIYEHFGMNLSPDFAAALEQERKRAGQYKSGHAYSLEQYGLTRERVYSELKDVFEIYGFEF